MTDGCIVGTSQSDPPAVDCYVPYKAVIDQHWGVYFSDAEDDALGLPDDGSTCGPITFTYAFSGGNATGLTPTVDGAPIQPCPKHVVTSFLVSVKVDADFKNGPQDVTLQLTGHSTDIDPSDRSVNEPETFPFIMTLHVGQCAPDDATQGSKVRPTAVLPVPGLGRSRTTGIRRPLTGVVSAGADFVVQPMTGGPQLGCGLKAPLTIMLLTPDFPDDAPSYAYESTGSGVAATTAKGAASDVRQPLASIPLPCKMTSSYIDAAVLGKVTYRAKIECPPVATSIRAVLSVSRYLFNDQDHPTSGPPEEHTQTCNSPSCDVSITVAAEKSLIAEYTPSYTGSIGKKNFPSYCQDKTDDCVFRIPFNAEERTYPQHQDTRQSDPRVVVPFPKPPPAIQKCAKAGHRNTTPGCQERDKRFAAKLRQAYIRNSWDRTIFAQHPIFAHHIQPLEWGGHNDDDSNGVFLTDPVHYAYTRWWDRLL